MKTKINASFLTLVFSFLIGVSLSAQTSSQDKQKETPGVSVYYFHFNTRCETCRAVEDETKADISMLFGNKVSFNAYNLDKPEGDAKGKELGVNSQMLLVVKGDTKIDLTNEGFLYARTDPDKFKKVIEEKIKPLL